MHEFAESALMNNLRLELFGGGSLSQVDGGNKMKKLFPKRAPKQSPPQIEHPDQLATSGHTLDRIVNAKEEVRT